MRLNRLLKTDNTDRLKVTDVRVTRRKGAKFGGEDPFLLVTIDYKVGRTKKQLTKTIFSPQDKDIQEVVPVIKEELGKALAFEAFREYDVLSDL